MKEPVYSKHFDDIYFSPDDGLAETQHVFLKGNNLPEAWTGCQHFTIGEAGFGTGLNFLAAWQLFDQTRQDGQILDYVAVEKYPLRADEIRAALEPWCDHFGDRIEAMLDQYPPRVAGFHRLVLSDGVRLTLLFGDINGVLPELVVPRGVNAWFLDGFAPAKNPEMWTETLYGEMARLSAQQATFATFTAAGHVRRGLEVVGFDVQKQKGFGRKRDMSVGIFRGQSSGQNTRMPQRIAILGGGLAGTSCLHVLRQYGFDPVLYETADHLAPGASGNVRGLYNPRFSALMSPESLFYASAYAGIIKHLRGSGIDYESCGTLHLINSDEKSKRFRSLVDTWQWHDDHIRLATAEEASDIAGIGLDYEALYLPDAGHVSPAKLCVAYAEGGQVRLNETPENLDDFDAVILACGAQVKDFVDLPVHTVRGQVTEVSPSSASQDMKCNVCFGGYISAPTDGYHIAGSTFQKWRDDVDVDEADDKDNLSRLAETIPALSGFEVRGGRAALRTSSHDRFPIIGKISEKLYVSTAHASHGLVSSFAGAHLIADMLCGGVYSQSSGSVEALDPARFERRAFKKSAGKM